MSELDCRDFDDIAAEFALGVLVGRDRAAALTHLDKCATCQRLVADLSAPADELLELIPEAEPTPNLERRILAAIPLHAVPPERPEVVPLRGQRYIKAAGLVAACLLAGLGLGTDAPPASPTLGSVAAPHTGLAPIPTENVVLYAPLTEGGSQVGQAYLYDGVHDWIYLSLDSMDNPGLAAINALDSNMTCTLVRPDGSTLRLGTFVLRHGRGSWAGAAPDPTGTSPTANVVDSAGRVVASAHFIDSDALPPASQVSPEPVPNSGSGSTSGLGPSTAGGSVESHPVGAQASKTSKATDPRRAIEASKLLR